jgi:hypothetical protein
VGFFPDVVNATKSKKEKADGVESENRPIPGLVIVSTPEGIHFCLILSTLPLVYATSAKEISTVVSDIQVYNDIFFSSFWGRGESFQLYFLMFYYWFSV